VTRAPGTPATAPHLRLTGLVHQPRLSHRAPRRSAAARRRGAFGHVRHGRLDERGRIGRAVRGGGRTARATMRHPEQPPLAPGQSNTLEASISRVANVCWFTARAACCACSLLCVQPRSGASRGRIIRGDDKATSTGNHLRQRTHLHECRHARAAQPLVHDQSRFPGILNSLCDGRM